MGGKLGVSRILSIFPHRGKVLTQNRVRELAEYENLALLCGHYEGVDERVIEELVDEEISIGDYVLNGGEVAVSVMLEAITA